MATREWVEQICAENGWAYQVRPTHKNRGTVWVWNPARGRYNEEEGSLCCVGYAEYLDDRKTSEEALVYAVTRALKKGDAEMWKTKKFIDDMIRVVEKYRGG